MMWTIAAVALHLELPIRSIDEMYRELPAWCYYNHRLEADAARRWPAGRAG